MSDKEATTDAITEEEIRGATPAISDEHGQDETLTSTTPSQSSSEPRNACKPVFPDPVSDQGALTA